MIIPSYNHFDHNALTFSVGQLCDILSGLFLVFLTFKTGYYKFIFN